MTEQKVTYSDPDGFRDYSGRDEWEIRMEKEVAVSAEVAWETWFTSIWEGQDGPTMLNLGEGRGRLGSARTFRLAGLTERIVSVGLPSPSSQPEAVPSISYSLENFMASSYLGYVRFFPAEPDAKSTRIVWCAKWTPSLAGRLFFGGHLLVRMLRSAMGQALDNLGKKAAAKQL
ncbi:MAG: hypothetical protein AB8G95_06960 [Anaerolineae bacterium]